MIDAAPSIPRKGGITFLRHLSTDKFLNLFFKSYQMKGNDKIFFGFVLAGLLLIYLLPDPFINHGHSLCIHYQITGIECPFCGFTRAIHSLMYFNIPDAIRYNFAIIPLFILLLNDILRRLTKITIFSLSNNYLLIITAGTLLVLYIFRIAKGIS